MTLSFAKRIIKINKKVKFLRIGIFIPLLCCFGILVSCKKNDFKGTSNVPQAISGTAIENSSEPSQTPEKPREKSASGNKEMKMIYGKWEILEMTGYGYIFGDVSMEDYVGGVVTIDADHIEVDLPMGKNELVNPKYKLTKQGENDFFMRHHANINNGFGFDKNQIEHDYVKFIEVYDGKDEWDEFGGTFWVRDEEHLIFEGPVYFLARKIE